MSKQKHMKDESFEVSTTYPTEIIGLTEVKGNIEIASKPSKLLRPVKYYADTITDLKAAKKALKDAIKEPTAKLKEIEATLKGLEKEIKVKALTLVETTQVQKVNKLTGEITYELVHNLPTLAFSYTPEKVITGIDFQNIQDEYDKNGERSKYRVYFEKIVSYKLDMNKLKADLAGGKKFPMTKKVVAETISIQEKALVNTKKQDELLKLIVAADEIKGEE